MRLKYQLFLALLAGGALLIALLAGIADTSFNRGFLDYVNRVENRRLEPLRTVLVEGYERSGDWSWIDARPSVGLAGAGAREHASGLEELFAARQRRSFLLASLALLPVSALMAWLLTTRIVRPLDALNAAVARIGDGDFAMRLPEERTDELGELSGRVNRLAAALESNLDVRRRWLAEISHELRTPVAVLQAELEAMQDGVSPVDEAALASLHGETVRLSRLIDDLRDLTLADVGALDYRFERIDLGDLVAERLDPARGRLAEAGIELVLGNDGPVPVDADDQRLAQLVDNLLQNSLRYTDAKGRLEVRIRRRVDFALLRWEDSAPGVPEPDLPHLFDPLYRVDDSRRRRTGGSGLGLAIVGKIAEAHGGRVRAAASPLGGLAIELELPLAAGPAPPPRGAAPA